jgi:hypothetical protein
MCYRTVMEVHGDRVVLRRQLVTDRGLHLAGELR